MRVAFFFCRTFRTDRVVVLGFISMNGARLALFSGSVSIACRGSTHGGIDALVCVSRWRASLDGGGRVDLEVDWRRERRF